MLSLQSTTARVAAFAVLTIAASPALGQGDSSSAEPGRIDLSVPDAPKPTVEIDLGRGLIRDLLGLGDSAIAGFVEGLMTAHDPQSAENAKFIAQQVASARELGEVASEVLHEVHVRVYDNLPEGDAVREKIAGHCESQLQQHNWESAVKVNDGDDSVRVFVARNDDAVQGVFILAGDGNDLVLANVFGDLSPTKVQRLTKTATKIAVKLGLEKELNKAVEQVRREIR